MLPPSEPEFSPTNMDIAGIMLRIRKPLQPTEVGQECYPVVPIRKLPNMRITEAAEFLFVTAGKAITDFKTF